MNWIDLIPLQTRKVVQLLLYMKDFSWNKRELSKELAIDVKTLKRHIEKIEKSNFPLAIVKNNKDIQIFYHQTYRETELIWFFLKNASAFNLLIDLVSDQGYRTDYSARAQRSLKEWLAQYHISFSYHHQELFGNEQAILVLVYNLLQSFPIFFSDALHRSLAETFLSYIHQKEQPKTIIFSESELSLAQIFPENTYDTDQRQHSLHQKEFIARIRFLHKNLNKKHWQKLNHEKEYQLLAKVVERIDAVFWVLGRSNNEKKGRITEILFKEWIRFTCGLHHRWTTNELENHTDQILSHPNMKEKLHMVQSALNQLGRYTQRRITPDWTTYILTSLQERAYIDFQPPVVRIALVFRQNIDEAKRIAELIEQVLSKKYPLSLHICTDHELPTYAEIIVTDYIHLSPPAVEQKVYYYAKETNAYRFIDRLENEVTNFKKRSNIHAGKMDNCYAIISTLSE